MDNVSHIARRAVRTFNVEHDVSFGTSGVADENAVLDSFKVDVLYAVA
jgi:hypothetical protein